MKTGSSNPTPPSARLALAMASAGERLPSKVGCRRNCRRVWPAGICVAALAAGLLPTVANAGAPRSPAGPKVLVLRGVFEVFSLGMNDLAKKLRYQGYDAEVTSWSLALLHAKCSDDRPLVIVGHSLGGRMCGWVPRKLRKCGRRVPLVVIVDANLIQRIPDNVDRCVHLYVTNKLGIFHGSPVRGEVPGMDIVNRDVSEGQPSFLQGGVNHFNIDATDWVHDIIIQEIAQRFPMPYPSGSPRKLTTARSRPGHRIADDMAPNAPSIAVEDRRRTLEDALACQPTRPEIRRTILPSPAEKADTEVTDSGTTEPADADSSEAGSSDAIDDSTGLSWRTPTPKNENPSPARLARSSSRIRIPAAWRPERSPEALDRRGPRGGTEGPASRTVPRVATAGSTPRIRIPTAWRPPTQTTDQASSAEWVAKRRATDPSEVGTR